MKKLSTAALKRMGEEEGTRVLTKTPSTAEKHNNSLKEEIGRLEVLMLRTLQAMTTAIGNQKPPTLTVPEPVVIQEPRPLIKNIHVKHIVRDGQNRLQSVDFDVEYVKEKRN